MFINISIRSIKNMASRFFKKKVFPLSLEFNGILLVSVFLISACTPISSESDNPVDELVNTSFGSQKNYQLTEIQIELEVIKSKVVTLTDSIKIDNKGGVGLVPGYNAGYLSENLNNLSNSIAIIEVDSCEYIVLKDEVSRTITHKGNCKFCITKEIVYSKH